MTIQDIFEENEEIEIPTLPEIFYHFKEVIDDPESSFSDIGDIVRIDPALTARLLKIVNSAMFGYPSKIETVSHAVSIIGRQELNDLILSAVVMGQFNNLHYSKKYMEAFWRHSIACGIVARIISSHMKKPNPERYFVAGILHDIGHLVIGALLPFEMLEITLLAKSKNITLYDAEHEVIGCDHAQAGGYLLKLWNLSMMHQETIAFHHNPERATHFSAEITLIQAADIVTHAMNLGLNFEGEIINETEEDFLKELNLPKNISFSNLKSQIETQLEQTARLFYLAA